MSNKIKILADSTCDLGPELAEKYDIGIMPLPVFLGEEQFADMQTVTPDDLYTYVSKSGKLPRTAAPNTQDYIDFWKPWIEQGYDILHFHIGSGFSGTYNASRIASEEYAGRVFPIDSENLSSGIALLILAAAHLRENSEKSAEEIAKEVSVQTAKVRTSFLVDNIEYLYKGGRCSGIAALGANLLKLKPCIEVIDGHMEPGKKYRGKTADVFASYVETKLKERKGLRHDHVFITHSGIDDEIVRIVQNRVREFQPDFAEHHIVRASCTISTHCGPGTLGILFIDDAE